MKNKIISRNNYRKIMKEEEKNYFKMIDMIKIKKINKKTNISSNNLMCWRHLNSILK